MSLIAFIPAMIATHLAYLLAGSAAALFLRGVRRSLERMAAELEAQVPTMRREER